jgi:hypothetical protein
MRHASTKKKRCAFCPSHCRMAPSSNLPIQPCSCFLVSRLLQTNHIYSLTILNIPTSQLGTSATMDVNCYFLHPVSQSLKGGPLSLWGGGTTPRASGEYTYQLNPLAPCRPTTQLTMSTNSDTLRTPLHTSMQRVSAPSRTPGSMPSRRETLLDGQHYRQIGCANTCTHLTLL